MGVDPGACSRTAGKDRVCVRVCMHVCVCHTTHVSHPHRMDTLH